MDSLFTDLGTKGSLSYDPVFVDFLEMHMANLRAHSVSSGQTIDLTPNDRLRADKDFNLLCNIAGIPFDMHWLTLRVNNFREYKACRHFDEPLYKVSPDYLSTLKLKFAESQSII